MGPNLGRLIERARTMRVVRKLVVANTGSPGMAGRLFVAGCVLFSGCGDGRVARYPVFGAVHVDGQPAEGAIVIFCPTETSPEAERLRPSGQTDAAGKFGLTTLEAGDGAPAGKYKVLVQWPAPSQAPAQDRSGRRGAAGRDRLLGQYFNLEKATLVATVEETSNELPPFELKSK
jgi:hypothetical protein